MKLRSPVLQSSGSMTIIFYFQNYEETKMLVLHCRVYFIITFHFLQVQWLQVLLVQKCPTTVCLVRLLMLLRKWKLLESVSTTVKPSKQLKASHHHPPVKRHLNGVLLVGRRLPSTVCLLGYLSAIIDPSMSKIIFSLYCLYRN